METAITGMIILHAASGGVALLAGGLAQAVTKGSSNHVRSGMVFYVSMLISAVSALIVSMLPGHENSFLFSIGVFTVYFVVSGYRAIGYRKADAALTLDRMLAYLMIAVGIGMTILPVILNGSIHIIMAVFGAMVASFAVRDVLVLRDAKKTRKNWLRMHIVKIMSAYISAATAFVVVNHLLPGLWAWFAPGVVVGMFITMWMRKLDKGTLKITSPKSVTP